jgi:hypothetical protein
MGRAAVSLRRPSAVGPVEVRLVAYLRSMRWIRRAIWRSMLGWTSMEYYVWIRIMPLLWRSAVLTAGPIFALRILCLMGSRCEATCGSPPSVTRPASYAGPFVYFDRIPDILLSSSGSEHRRRFGPMRTRSPSHGSQQMLVEDAHSSLPYWLPASTMQGNRLPPQACLNNHKIEKCAATGPGMCASFL